MVFPLLRHWFGPLLPSFLRSSRYASGSAKKYKTPTGFRTIGGGDGGKGGGPISGSARASKRTKGSSSNPVEIHVSFTESEERMMSGGAAPGDVRLQRLSKAAPASVAEAAAAAEARQGGVYSPTTSTVTVNEREDDAALPAGNSIFVSSEVEVTSDRARHGEQRPQRPHEAW